MLPRANALTQTDQVCLQRQAARTHLVCRWRRGSAGGDSGWPRLIHRSSAGGRRSRPYLPPWLSHSPPAPPDNGLRERKMGVNTVIHGEKKMERRGTNSRDRCGGQEVFNLLLTWDGTFQNKALKAPFIYSLFVIWTQQEEEGKGRGAHGDGDEEIERARGKTPKNSTSKRGSLWTMCSYD